MSSPVFQPFQEIAVLGPGLIGGSLVLAVKQRLPGTRVRVWARREEVVEQLAAQTDVVDLATSSVEEAVAGADLVVLAMPTGYMASVVEAVSAFGPSDGVVVTDVGSVKGPVVEALTPLVAARGACFVGSHPMAGSEQSGWEHAAPGLFDGASVILTPGDSREQQEAGRRLQDFWSRLGGRVSLLSPVEHDHAVAAISHLPHLVAAALVKSVLAEDPGLARFSGGGFRDTTRVASGLEDMWSHILTDNREAVTAGLEKLIHELEGWKALLTTPDRAGLLESLGEARRLRETWL